jgi:dihydroorotase
MDICGKLLYKGKIVEAGIKVENGIVKEINKRVKGKKVRGIILPAAIDVHVHFRDFNEKHKETIESGSLSALYGGVCLAVDQPNTMPRIEDDKIYLERIAKAEKTSYIDYTLNMGLTLKNAERINEIIKKIEEKGYSVPAIGEVFIQHNDANLQIDYRTLADVKSKIRKLITLHAEDPEMIEGEGVPNYLFRLPQAEVEAVKRCIEIGRFHFCHISTLEALSIIKRTDSTVEVTPHHILLSVEDEKRLGRLINVNPPLRDKENAEALLGNISNADIIASDHAPHTVDEKEEKGLPGFPGVETMYPLLMNLVRKGVVGINTVIEKIAVNPARIFGFDGYGEIEVGKYANFAVFDFSNVRKIRCDELHSKAGWTPYEGFEGIFPYKVFIRGVEALDGEDVLIDPGFGMIAGVVQ